MRPIPGLRWWIVGLLFTAAALNYVDRQTLGNLAPTIQRDLAMDDRAYANVLNIFLIAYTLSFLVAGKLTDKIGTRAGLCFFVIWWSLADMLTAAAQGPRSLGAARFTVGLAEAGVWPAASKAVSEWFPARERALAIGLYTMGATIGATLTPYLVIPMASFAFEQKAPLLYHFFGQGTGWRLAFVLIGLLGLLWVVPWLIFYRVPRKSNLISEQELRLIEEKPVGAANDGTAHGTEADATPWSWGRILTSRVVWLLLLARLITDPVWYFYQFWFPKYLSVGRHLSQEQLKISWVVYAAAGVGSLLGGWLSGRLVRHGLAPASSRIWIMLGCACIMPLSAFVFGAPGMGMMMTLTACTVCAALAWLTNIASLVVDIIPRHSLGTVFSVVAAGSTVGGIIMNLIVGTMVSGPSVKAGFMDVAIQRLAGPVLHLVQGHGYAQWFLIMAFLHPVGWCILKFGGIERPVARPR